MSEIFKSPTRIVNYFLRRGEKEGLDFTNFALNKLAYIAEGWALAQLDESLFDEQIQAWRFGPVIPSVYHEFKRFGNVTIPVGERAVHLADGEIETPYPDSNDEKLGQVLDNVWFLYADLTFDSLKKLTHQKGTPWYEAWNDKRGYEGNRDIVITRSAMKKHFSKKIKQYISISRKNAA